MLFGGVCWRSFSFLHPGRRPTDRASRADQPVRARAHTRSRGHCPAAAGLPALIARSAARYGPIAWTGFALAFVGTYLLGGVMFFDAYITPAIAANAPALMGRHRAINTPPTVLAFAVAGALWGLGYLVLGIVGLARRSCHAGRAQVDDRRLDRDQPAPQPIGIAPLVLIAFGAVAFRLRPEAAGEWPSGLVRAGLHACCPRSQKLRWRNQHRTRQ